jgi:isopenicillin N synthase-like dioxygenase
MAHPPEFPVVDLRAPGVETAVDAALSSVGFFMLSGHGVPAALIDGMRAVALEFFHLPIADKEASRTAQLGESRWAPMGLETNGYSFSVPTPPDMPIPPDMKESYRIGAHLLPGRVALRGENRWPAAPPRFREVAEAFTAAVDRINMDLLRVCAAALGLEREYFARHAARNDNTLNINWYPDLGHVGPPRPGQYRVGPHTDFGTLTVLHRETGRGGLQVRLADGTWVDAPDVPGAFTINAGDMLALWSGGRWRSAVHRVLPPSPEAPTEELLSLVYFCEPDPETVIEPLGGGPSVVAGEYLRAKIEAITTG